MFLIRNEAELRACFRELEQAEVRVANDLQFPLRVRDYLRWLEPSGARAYLVFRAPGARAPLGIVFRRDQSLGPGVAAMCEWCHSVRSGNEVGMLTVASSPRKRVGLSLCRDLSCGDKVRAAPGPDDFAASMGAGGTEAAAPLRLRRVIERMALFARRELI